MAAELSMSGGPSVDFAEDIVLLALFADFLDFLDPADFFPDFLPDFFADFLPAWKKYLLKQMRWNIWKYQPQANILIYTLDLIQQLKHIYYA